MSLFEIEPVRHVMPIQPGVVAEFTFEAVSDPELVEQIRNPFLHYLIHTEIREQVSWGHTNGRHVFNMELRPQVNGRKFFEAAVSYSVVPEYRMLSRIFAWWYNYNSDEALSPEDFREAYGPALGDHIYSKWQFFNRDLTRMIGYFGTEEVKGQKFLCMLMRRVVQYEERMEELSRALYMERIKKYRKSPAKFTRK